MNALAPGATGEFDLIARFFSGLGAARRDVALGVGDDAAIVEAGQARLVTAIATVNRPGPHAGAAAVDALAAKLTAAGATPAWVTLALTVPNIDPDWLGPFSAGLQRRLEARGLQLIGGDTTRGPLAFTLVAHGRLTP